jgi:hypothetical protein
LPTGRRSGTLVSKAHPRAAALSFESVAAICPPTSALPLPRTVRHRPRELTFWRLAAIQLALTGSALEYAAGTDR